ncbi:MAG: RnfABCDGE type electron transport complex subunit G [Gemmatimonadota bacterium]
MTAAAHQHGSPASVTPGKATPTWKLLVTLAIAGALSGWLVATVYRLTLPAVQRYAAARVEGAIREVLESPTRWDTLYLVGGAITKSAPSGVDPAEVPTAYVGFDAAGKRTGVAVTAAEPGFQELLTLMIGFNPEDGRLLGFKVLDEKETPGLGDKIETDSSFRTQFAGKLPPLAGVKGRPGGTKSEVQTITGATISSRAVIRIVNHAVAKWQPLLQTYDRARAP